MWVLWCLVGQIVGFDRWIWMIYVVVCCVLLNVRVVGKNGVFRFVVLLVCLKLDFDLISFDLPWKRFICGFMF